MTRYSLSYASEPVTVIPDSYVAKQELADALGLSRWTVQRWCRGPNPPPFILLPSGRKRFQIQAVVGWLRQRDLRSNQK